MTLQEILKEKGLTDEQIEAVIGEMKQHKIFTAGEENLDTRYSKLKTDHEGVSRQLTEAQSLIEQLKKETGSNESLQGKIADYESKVAVLTAENEKLKTESALKVALLDAGAKAADMEYLLFKANQSGEIKLTDDGKIKGQEELVSSIKTQCPAQFTSAEQKKVQEHKLESGDPNAGALTRSDILKKPYSERLAIYEKDPETYREIMKG